MTAPKPPDSERNEIDLTPEDEAALDKAWDSVTDAEIEASIAWLDEVERDKAPVKPKPAPEA